MVTNDGWQEVEEFPGYLVDAWGNIMNEWSNRPLRTRVNREGFAMVGMMLDGKQYTRSLASIVARAFVHNQIPDHFTSVIHLNGERTDCRALNLMWRSRPFAIRYHDMFDQPPYRVSVQIPALNEYYYSLREACTTHGLIEQVAYVNMQNREPCFPYPWIIEKVVD